MVASKPVKIKRKKPRLLYWIFISIFILLYFAFKHYEDMVIEYPDGKVVLKPERLRDFDDKKGKIKDGVVLYKLIAIKNGNYFCSFCFEQSFYLMAGEVYRYGITAQAISKRYILKELKSKGLRFVELDRGSLEQMRLKELELIVQYPLLPENQVRPYREKVLGDSALFDILLRYKIGRPIGNPVDR